VTGTGKPLTVEQKSVPERRGAMRGKSFLRGRIIFNNRLSSIDCIVRDINDLGARLSFGGTVSVPEVFDLEIPNKQEHFRARVIWHHGMEIGVAFGTERSVTPETHADHPDATLIARVERLEKELAAMKRKLEQIRPSND
jgi:PilZ domain-containing protein